RGRKGLGRGCRRGCVCCGPRRSGRGLVWMGEAWAKSSCGVSRCCASVVKYHNLECHSDNAVPQDTTFVPKTPRRSWHRGGSLPQRPVRATALLLQGTILRLRWTRVAGRSNMWGIVVDWATASPEELQGAHMVPLTELWLPVILSAVGVFVSSS